MTYVKKITRLEKEMMNTIQSIKTIEELRFNLTPFNDIEYFSKLPGIYAVAYTGKNFPISLNEQDLYEGEIIYIGKTTKSARSRILNTHFKTGRTGSSTLRRSIGAILRERLNLTPVKRGLSHSGVRDFKFIDESERLLTTWMVENLSVSFVPCNHGKRLLNELESDIIYILNPILNISKNSRNDKRFIIKELRKKCREISKI